VTTVRACRAFLQTSPPFLVLEYPLKRNSEYISKREERERKRERERERQKYAENGTLRAILFIKPRCRVPPDNTWNKSDRDRLLIGRSALCACNSELSPTLGYAAVATEISITDHERETVRAMGDLI
jgi:hypothetical protein